MGAPSQAKRGQNMLHAPSCFDLVKFELSTTIFLLTRISAWALVPFRISILKILDRIPEYILETFHAAIAAYPGVDFVRALDSASQTSGWPLQVHYNPSKTIHPLQPACSRNDEASALFSLFIQDLRSGSSGERHAKILLTLRPVQWTQKGDYRQKSASQKRARQWERGLESKKMGIKAPAEVLRRRCHGTEFGRIVCTH